MNRLFISLLFFLISIISKSSSCDAKEFNIEKVKLGKNLTLPQLSSIKQDSLGFIWFSSRFSIFRYDGKHLDEFKMEFPIQKLPYEEKIINDIVFDSFGNIWLATTRGLVCFSIQKEKFYYFKDSGLHLSDFSMKVISIAAIAPGKILFNSKDKLYTLSYPKKQKDFTNKLKLKIIDDIPIGKVTLIKKTKKNNFWLGSSNGICILDRNLNFDHIVNWTTVYGDKIDISSFFEDNNGNLWIGTKGDGLLKVEIKSSKITKYNPGNSSKLIYNIVGNNKNLFVATSLGLKIIDIKNPETNLSRDYLPNKILISIFIDNSGVIWTGSLIRGLFKFTTLNNFYSIIQPKKELNLTPYYNNNVAIIEKDSRGNIWSFYKGYFRQRRKEDLNQISKVDLGVGVLSCRYFKIYNDYLYVALSKGIEVFDLNTKKPVVNSDVSFLKSFAKDRIICQFIKDKKGNFWFLEKSGELNLICKKDENNFSKKTILEKNISFIKSSNLLFSDSNERIWIYMIHSGLRYYDYKNNSLNQFEFDSEDGKNNEYFIGCILEDSNKNIWFGTQDGLIKYSYDHEIRKITASDQMSIFSLEEGESNKIWGTSQSHFFYINTKTEVIDEFDIEKENHDIAFFPNKVLKLDDNSLIYPLTSSGLLRINPKLMPIKTPSPEVVISEIKIHNIDLNNNSPLESYLEGNSIFYIEHLKLKYNQNNLTFGFIGLNYKNQDNILYEYKMSGIDKQWIRNGTNTRFVNFSNLKPGQYTFKVRASYDGDFSKSKIKELDIIIEQAWWKTYYAFLIYLLMFIIAVYSIWRYTLDRFKLKEQLKLEKFRNKKEKELNQAKLEFFTNISHEFKTPLSLLIGPLNKLIKENISDNERQNLYSLMFRNTDRLLRLINQIMDFRKAANDSFRLKVINDNLTFYVQNIFNYFIDATDHKNIEFKLICDNEILVWFDPEIIEKITTNLISNAIKYTENGGKITVQIVKLDKDVKIIIRDNGIGIHKEDINHIFDRFYRAKKRNILSNTGGTGIGLALTKQLVELHKGAIQVESTIGKGSTFTVTIGTDKSIFSKDQLVVDKIKSFIEGSNRDKFIDNNLYLSDKQDELIGQRSSIQKHKLLLVEDDYDLRKFMKDFFKSSYIVYEAEDGEKGLKIALEKAPDIIISDIMMPIMNGLDFCKQVKSNIAISHLPVILLTAKTKIENQIEGLETGADSYIAKPFDPHYLEVVARKLLDTRKHLREKFDRKFVELTTNEIKLTNADQLFLDKVINIIEENISNTELRIEDVYTKLGLGRTHFHNKMKAITNQTGGDFIRSVRLKRAAFLLKNHKIRISDICYDVGFSDPKYFGKVFRKYFGVSPREYSKKHNNEIDE